MPVKESSEIERDGLYRIAELMAVAARTSPKTRGVDEVVTAIVTGDEKDVHLMEYNDSDIEAFRTIIDEALSYSSPNQVNILYFSLSIGDAQYDEDWYNDWLKAAQEYVEAGKVEWKSINEMYEEYIAKN